MRVTVTYNDLESFTEAEALHNNSTIFGNNAEVSVAPASNSPEALIYFAVQNLISVRQLEAYFDKSGHYILGKQKLREEMRLLMADIVEKVLEDNIEKCE